MLLLKAQFIIFKILNVFQDFMLKGHNKVLSIFIKRVATYLSNLDYSLCQSLLLNNEKEIRVKNCTKKNKF